jgi:peroxiredoxin
MLSVPPFASKEPTMPDSLSLQIQSAETEWLSLWKRGPTRLRWGKVPLQTGDAAPDFELQDSAGHALRLRDVWPAGPVLLMFWRHYGCSCGADRARRLQAECAAYKALGAQLLIIGQGGPAQAADYAARHELTCPVLCDPTRSVYEDYDLLEGQPSQIVFDAPDEFLKIDAEAGARLQASRHGTPRAAVNSPWQLPGEFVIDTAGKVRLAHRYQHCEDWPNPLVLIAALKESAWVA